LVTFAKENREENNVDIQIIKKKSHDLWGISHIDETFLQHARKDEDVHEALSERDGSTGSRLYSYRSYNLFFYWIRDLHPDESEHRKSLDAQMGGWIYHPRNYALGVFEFYYVPDIVWKSGLQHRFRIRNDEGNTAN